MLDKTKNSILIVDDEATNLSVLTHLLRSEYTIYVTKDGASAIEMAGTHLPDLILLDIVMGDIDGYQVLHELREIESTKNIPIIFITGLDSKEDEEKGLSLEVADYISKPFTPNIVKLRVRNQIRMINYMREIQRLSMTDALTGLSNRRCFNDTMEREWSRAMREQQPLSLLILDIDHFKRYNDTYGHQNGDLALQTMATLLRKACRRASDSAARWGGEEFTMLLPMTNAEGAMVVAEEIRQDAEKLEIAHSDGTKAKLTVSIGVFGLAPSASCEIQKFITKADQALYTAKEQGRNRVVAATGDCS